MSGTQLNLPNKPNYRDALKTAELKPDDHTAVPNPNEAMERSMFDKIKMFKDEGVLDRMMKADMGAEFRLHAQPSKAKDRKDLLGRSPADVMGNSPARLIRKNEGIEVIFYDSNRASGTKGTGGINMHSVTVDADGNAVSPVKHSAMPHSVCVPTPKGGLACGGASL